MLVRVRVQQRLLNGFCQAILSAEVRTKWGFVRGDSRPVAGTTEKVAARASNGDAYEQCAQAATSVKAKLGSEDGGATPVATTKVKGSEEQKGGGRAMASAATLAVVETVANNNMPWRCGRCHVANSGTKRRCGGCLAWRGAGGQIVGGGGRDGTIKTIPDSASAAALDDRVPAAADAARRALWECHTCGFDNFAAASQCLACRARRPVWPRGKWRRLEPRVAIEAEKKFATTAATEKDMLTNRGSTCPAPTASPVVVPISVRRPDRGSSEALHSCDDSSAADMSDDKPNVVVDSSVEGGDTNLLRNSDYATSSSWGGHDGEYNYYGNCCNSVDYACISLHYDFNQSFYSNHDYSYLNSGLVMGNNARGRQGPKS